MKYRLYAGLGLLVLMAAALFVQRRWLATEDNKTAHAAAPTGPIKLKESDQWRLVPEYLSNATILGNDTPTSAELHYVASKDGVLLLAASWTYDGNIGDDEAWTPQCQTLVQLRQDGWTPIGKMFYSDGDRYYIFRRTVHAGEKLKIQTRLKTPGFLLEVPGADVAAVMAAEPLVPESRKTFLEVDLPESSEMQAGTSLPGAIALHSPEPDQLFGKYSRLGLLLREIVRQGVLLTSREELGLSTRDNSLRELSRKSDDSTGAPLEVVAISQPLNEMLFGIFRRQNDRWEALCDDNVRYPANNLYERVTTTIESQSRNEFVAALKRAGFEGAPPVKTREHAPVPPEAAALADELDIPALYGAVRCLHAEIRQNGQSPELLSALSRSYALLSVLTDHLWSPASKVFQARALLYSERAAQHWPQSALALYTRAYVRALVGLHRTALEDSAAATKIRKQNSGDEPPPWATAIEAYCQFDAVALEAAAQVESQRRFVRLLQLLAAESSHSEHSVIVASHSLFEEVPGCLRAIDGGTDVNQLGFYRYVVALGTESAKRDLLLQVRKVPNLPEPVAKQINDFQTAAKGGMLTRILHGEPPDEMATRLKVISALREASEANKGEGEPSWQVLAQLLEDVNFVDAWRQVNVAAFWLGVPADDVIDATAAQVAQHPYGEFLETYRSDSPRAVKAQQHLIKTLEIGLLSRVEDPLIQRLHRANPAWSEEHFPFGLYSDDAVASDLVMKIRNATEPQRVAVRLRDVSPHMPFGIVLGINYDLDGLRKQKQELEKKYASDGQVMAMLGRSYCSEQKSDDAIRCFKAAIKQDPSRDVFLALSDIYLQKGDEANWLSTLEDFLKTDDYGLGHAQVQVKIADHFISKDDWARARPYADAAAETWAAWALLKAAQCAEAMQDWDAAEKWYAAVSQRYSDNVWAWYEFCRRTGQGDQNQALRMAMPWIRRIEHNGTVDERFRAAVERALAKQPQEAAAIFDEVYRLQPTTLAGLHALLAFDESGDTKSRDRILDAMHARRAEEAAGPQSTFAELGELIYSGKRDGAFAQADLGKLEEIVGEAAENERTVLLFLIGWYLDRAGQKTQAIDFWKRCMRERFNDPCSCTRSLAGAALLDRGVAPASYLPEQSKTPSGKAKQPARDEDSL